MGRNPRMRLLVVLGLVAGALVAPSSASAAQSCDGKIATITGTGAADRIVGTAAADVIVGLGGDDTIIGLGGDDTICGGAGDDTIRGSGGDDTVFGEAGDDILFGGFGGDTLWGGDGNDRLLGQSHADTLHGDAGNDRLAAGAGGGLLDGGPGNDMLIGGIGADTMRGGAGIDRLFGRPDDDTLWGGSGNDSLRGNTGDDTLHGDEGDDRLWGGRQDDTLDGGAGDDTLKGESGNDTADGGADTDTCSAEVEIACERHPGEPVWVRTGGPIGGLGYDVRMRPDDPDVMLVSDGWAGVFMSTNGGTSWFPSNDGITVRAGFTGSAIPVFSITIDPHDPDIVWAGTQYTRGIFKSTDGGRTWAQMNSGVVEGDGISFRGFAVDPRSSDTVYAAAEISSWTWAGENRPGLGFDLVKGVVYKTVNGGQSWSAVWRGDNLARYIWIDPTDPDTLYVSTGIFDREAANSDPDRFLPGGVGVLKSTDGGETWNRVNNGLGNLYIGTLFMHPDNPQILLAGAGHNTYPAGSGVYRTTNGGESWTRVLGTTGVEQIHIHSVEFALSDPDIAYAASDGGVYRSEDAGVTWRRQTSEMWGPPNTRVGFPIDLQVDPRDPDRLFINAYGGGNFLSTDGGRTWKTASTGYTGAQIRGIAVDPEHPGRVWAAGRSGLFESRDGGTTWAGISPFGGWPTFECMALAIAGDGSLLEADNVEDGIAHGSDAGWSYTELPLGDRQGVRALAFAPSDSSIAYAGVGAYFTPSYFDETRAGGGVYRTDDRGRTWSAVGGAAIDDAHVMSVAVDPTDPDTVFAGTTDRGLLRSDNAGATWRRVGGIASAQVSAVGIHPDDPNMMLIGARGMLRSTDGGASWATVAGGPPAESFLVDFAFDPSDPDVVYAADLSSGVYRSTDRGRTWTAMVDGLNTKAVWAIDVSDDGKQLYAATEGEGVYRLDLTGTPPARYRPPAPITGVVTTPEGQPVAGATVRVQATDRMATTDSTGAFRLAAGGTARISASAPGFYIGGGVSADPGDHIEITLATLPTDDNTGYEWRSSVSGTTAQAQACVACHSAGSADEGESMPGDQWSRDAHGLAATNERFLTMYAGTDVHGNRSPPTRYVWSPEYGRMPLPPDPALPYFGPGYRLDFPATSGNCGACHLPLAAADDPYSVDPRAIDGVPAEGISCDFCHKVWDVRVATGTGLPDPGMPGVVSIDLLRPPDGHQFFAGPFDDVAPGEDAYSPLQRESRYCAACHFGKFWDTVVYDSYGEWLRSPYADPETGMTCQDCHMPPPGATHFALAERGGLERDPSALHSHLMPGASDEELLRSALDLELAATQTGDVVDVAATVTNVFGGHHVPTDSPLRHVMLIIEATSPDGAPLELVDGPVLPDWCGIGSPADGRYAGLPGVVFAKVLKELWTGISPTGAYWNPTILVSDTRIPALTAKTSSHRFAAPDGARIEARLVFRRAPIGLMDQKGWQVPDIEMARSELQLP